MKVQPDPEPLRNSFIRSDQYSFIRHGIPALAMKVGYEQGSPDAKLYKDWLTQRYHAPSDDTNQPVDLQSAARIRGHRARPDDRGRQSHRAPAMEIRQLLPALRAGRLIRVRFKFASAYFFCDASGIDFVGGFVWRRPERIRAFSDITKSAIHIHIVNDQRKSAVFHFRNRIEFSDELFDRDRGARHNCIRPRRDARRRIGVRQFAPDAKSRPRRHSGHRSQQRLFVRVQLRFILPDELFHLILREVFRKPISGIRQREDCKRRVELRGLYCGERIQKWLVLVFESFGVVTESGGSICNFGKGTGSEEGNWNARNNWALRLRSRTPQALMRSFRRASLACRKVSFSYLVVAGTPSSRSRACAWRASSEPGYLRTTSCKSRMPACLLPSLISACAFFSWEAATLKLRGY